MTFDRYSIVRVPFPFSDRTGTKNRPAVVLSGRGTFNTPAGHSVMAMITSEDNPPWPLDCTISDLEVAGLPAPSKVRLKLFTLDHRLVRGAIGKLSNADAEHVSAGLSQLLGDNPDRAQP